MLPGRPHKWFERPCGKWSHTLFTMKPSGAVQTLTSGVGYWTLHGYGHTVKGLQSTIRANQRALTWPSYIWGTYLSHSRYQRICSFVVEVFHLLKLRHESANDLWWLASNEDDKWHFPNLVAYMQRHWLHNLRSTPLQKLAVYHWSGQQIWEALLGCGRIPPCRVPLYWL